jgi:hypothetical protein
MGTQAHWFRSLWRYRILDADGDPGPWTHADTLADIKVDVGDYAAEVQKRTGRAREGYVYRDHSTIDAHEYDIERYGEGEWERVHTETDKTEATARLGEYRKAEPTIAFRIRRVKASA